MMHINEGPQFVSRVRARSLFPILVVATAMYFTALMQLPFDYYHAMKILYLVPLQVVAMVAAVIGCGTIQHAVLCRRGVKAGRLWASVTFVGLGVPLLGAWLALGAASSAVTLREGRCVAMGALRTRTG
jgi:hypothetical protein